METMETKKTKKIDIRVTDEQKAALKKKADAMGMKVGTYLLYLALYKENEIKNG